VILVPRIDNKKYIGKIENSKCDKGIDSLVILRKMVSLIDGFPKVRLSVSIMAAALTPILEAGNPTRRRVRLVAYVPPPPRNTSDASSAHLRIMSAIPRRFRSEIESCATYSTVSKG